MGISTKPQIRRPVNQAANLAACVGVLRREEYIYMGGALSPAKPARPWRSPSFLDASSSREQWHCSSSAQER
jgi:hypothetical protein